MRYFTVPLTCMSNLNTLPFLPIYFLPPGECFLYTNSAGKLNYLVGGEVMTLCHLSHPMYLLGYVPKEDRAFLVDKTYNVHSYKLLLSMLSYQSAVVRQDFVTANSLLPLIPKSEYPAVAR